MTNQFQRVMRIGIREILGHKKKLEYSKITHTHDDETSSSQTNIEVTCKVLHVYSYWFLIHAKTVWVNFKFAEGYLLDRESQLNVSITNADILKHFGPYVGRNNPSVCCWTLAALEASRIPRHGLLWTTLMGKQSQPKQKGKVLYKT